MSREETKPLGDKQISDPKHGVASSSLPLTLPLSLTHSSVALIGLDTIPPTKIQDTVLYNSTAIICYMFVRLLGCSFYPYSNNTNRGPFIFHTTATSISFFLVIFTAKRFIAKQPKFTPYQQSHHIWLLGNLLCPCLCTYNNIKIIR